MLNCGASDRLGAHGRKGKGSSDDAEGASGELADRAQATILLIEDHDDVAHAIGCLLEDEGYTVERCCDAIEALERLTAGGALPDLILLDLMLPRMDGWEFRVEQRRHPALADIPIIALSADDSAKARAIDAAAFLQKPVHQQLLIATVRNTHSMTERRRREASEAHDARVGALGAIASGLAHEINNPLAAVIGSLELASRRSAQLLPVLDEPHKQTLSSVQALVTEAHHGSLRVAEVARNIAAFARSDRSEASPLDVQSVLEASIRLVGNELRHRARLDRAYTQVPPVIAHAGTLGQMFLNILIHVIHELGDDSEDAHIQVSTAVRDGRVVISIGQASRSRELLANDGMATARDGSGVRPLGLGVGFIAGQKALLAVGGNVEVETSSAGTNTFRVSLPVSVPVQRAQGRPRTDGGDAPRIRVLAIDDEEMMCDMLQAMLADTFELTTCMDAREGLERLLREPFDAVLCDLMMPGLNGMELHRQLKAKRPDLAERVLFMTGGTFTDAARAFLDEPGRQHIDKPFRVDELIRKLKMMVADLGPSEPQPSVH